MDSNKGSQITSIEGKSLAIIDHPSQTICSHIGDHPVCDTLVQGGIDGINSDVDLAYATIEAYKGNIRSSAKTIGEACLAGIFDAGTHEIRTHLTGDREIDINLEDHCVIA
jgi:hypothetical protein